MLGFDEARVGPLKEVASRVFSIVGAIAILAVLDLLPERIAEIAVGVGAVVLLAAAAAPLFPSRSRTSTDQNDLP